MGWNANDWIAVAGVAQVGVLSAAALYARGQVREARRLRAFQYRPYVVVYLTPSNAARTLIDLVVENIGQTPAHNVSIEFSPKLRSSMDSDLGEDRVNDWVALAEGIPYLAPRQRMTHLLENSITRFNSDLPRRYDVTVSYSDAGSAATKPKPVNFCEKYVIDIGIGFGSHYVSEKGLHEIGGFLEKMSKAMDQWTEGLDGVRIYTVDLNAYEEKRRRILEERYASFQHAQQNASEEPGEATPPEGSLDG